jgi:hypothetical protein
MATTSVVALTGSLLAGKTNWGPITPVVGTVAIQIAIDRAGLALLTQPFTWNAELSTDAGLTWNSIGGGGSVAGQISDIHLVLFTESSTTKNLPTATNANTRLRGSITLGETVVTTITIRQT